MNCAVAFDPAPAANQGAVTPPPAGNRVFNAHDISLGDDGFGNACFILPDGETITLAGLSPAEVSINDLYAILETPQAFSAGGSTDAPLETNHILCFTPGAMILTNQGDRAIETLRIGDLVVTRDQGLRPIRWIGSRTLCGRDQFAPVRIMGDASQTHDQGLLVSPQHRILYAGYRAELLFGTPEVLVTASDLVDGKIAMRAPCDTVTYVHLMFDHHEVIYADGVATESFHASDEGLSALDPASRDQLFALFPELRTSPTRHLETARACLRSHEAALLANDQSCATFA